MLLAVRAAKRPAKVVRITSGDSVAFGFVVSLALPGGNITGSSNFSREFCAKRVELDLRKPYRRYSGWVSYLIRPISINNRNLPAMEQVANLIKIGLQRFEVSGAEEFKDAFSAIHPHPCPLPQASEG